MTIGVILFTCFVMYPSVGTIWYVAEMYKTWYNGDPLTGEDFLNIPLAAIMWPVVLVDKLSTWWHNRLSRSNQTVKFRERVIVKGRLSARVERALKE